MVYIIGDTHLAIGDKNKSMEVFGTLWDNYMEKLRKNWLETVKENDSVIIAGDFSWAMNMEEALEDFKYIDELPGTKYILKGNHDFWWSTVSKMDKFLKENGIENIHFIYNNAYIIEDVAVVGAKGWSTLNPEEEFTNIRREKLRLENSIASLEKQLKNIPDEEKNKIRKVCVFHYPPIYREDVKKRYLNYLNSLDITEEEKKQMIEDVDYIEVLKKNNITKCYYGHLHGDSHSEAIQGNYMGIDFSLISGDYTNFKLTKI